MIINFNCYNKVKGNKINDFSFNNGPGAGGGDWSVKFADRSKGKQQVKSQLAQVQPFYHSSFNDRQLSLS